MNTHSPVIAYILWIFGFTGAHRFYFGRPITGTIWFFTFGLFGIGWLIDVILIPFMAAKADRQHNPGAISHDVGWVLLTFLGMFGLHRMYARKWITGIIYFFTGGLFLVGYLYDLWTFNSQIDEQNARFRNS